MDLFASIASSASAAPSASVSASSAPEPIRVSIEQIKKRTVTVIYNMDLALEPTVKTPKEFLSKLKKSVCNSNGFIRAPGDDDSSSSEEESSSEEDEESAKKPAKIKVKVAKPVQTGFAYVINGNHSNTICRYLYGLGVKSIIRTGTA